MLLYVDDLLIHSKSKKRIQSVKKALMKKFKMKNLGEIKECLGINVDYDYHKCEMKLSQSLANKYQLQNNKLYSTPMETNLKIKESESCEYDIKYRNLISALL